MNFLSTTGLPAWVIPGAIVHVALFLTMILPAWRAFAYARLSGPMALVLAVPVIGLLVVAAMMAGAALRRAGWPVISVLLLFVPVINVFYMWMFGFGRWTSDRAAIRKRTEAAAALAAGEEAIEPSARVQNGEAAEIPAGSGPDPADAADSDTDSDATDTEATEARPTDAAADMTFIAGAAEGAPAAEAAPAKPAPETPPAGTDMTFIAGAGDRAPAAAEAPSKPAPEPPATGEDMTFIAGAGGSTPDADEAPPAEEPPAPEAPPTPPPTAEQDMTYVAGSGGSDAGKITAWLLRGIDGRSKNFAMRLHEEDLLDADNGILIGRSNRAHFIINDESVSRNHARLLLIGGQLMVEDLDAMNGVWVAGQRLQPRSPAPLDIGTEFAIGKVNMRVDPVT